jgi:hypothetical protein
LHKSVDKAVKIVYIISVIRNNKQLTKANKMKKTISIEGKNRSDVVIDIRKYNIDPKNIDNMILHYTDINENRISLYDVSMETVGYILTVGEIVCHRVTLYISLKNDLL